MDPRQPHQAQRSHRPAHQGWAEPPAPPRERRRRLRHQCAARLAHAAARSLRGPRPPQRAADLRVDQRLRRDGRRGEQARLRQHRALGAHGPDGPRARLTRRATRPLPAWHGRSSHGHVAVRGDHGRSLSSRAHRTRHHGGHLAHGQRALDERHPRPGHSLRGAHRGAPTPRGGHQCAGQPLPLPGRPLVHAHHHR